jgi:hypothetical protein
MGLTTSRVGINGTATALVGPRAGARPVLTLFFTAFPALKSWLQRRLTTGGDVFHGTFLSFKQYTLCEQFIVENFKRAIYFVYSVELFNRLPDAL